MINLIFLINIIYFIKIETKKKKKLNQKKNNHIKNHVSIITKTLFNEFNEICFKILNVKDSENYNIIFLKRYLNEINFSNYNNNPIISIIIPIFNGKKYIIRSLLSIYSQTIKNIKIIYVDDCSIDNSTELIKKFKR